LADDNKKQPWFSDLAGFGKATEVLLEKLPFEKLTSYQVIFLVMWLAVNMLIFLPYIFLDKFDDYTPLVLLAFDLFMIWKLFDLKILKKGK
jgi:hypothetical protein